MPPMTLTRLKDRIGDLGLPRCVWIVYPCSSADEIVSFYDRDKAQAYADERPLWSVGTRPMRVMDADL